MKYQITDEDELRRAFWDAFPELSRRKITDYSGTGLMFCTDTRCAWTDFIDRLSKDGVISSELAFNATLDE